jgi:hypothetical protein
MSEGIYVDKFKAARGMQMVAGTRFLQQSV